MKKTFFRIFLTLLMTLFFGTLILVSISQKDKNVLITVNATNTPNIDYQLFYITEDGQESFNEQESIKINVPEHLSFQNIKFNLPVQKIKNFRLDIGSGLSVVDIASIEVREAGKRASISGSELGDFVKNDISQYTTDGKYISLHIDGQDPYIYPNKLTDFLTIHSEKGSVLQVIKYVGYFAVIFLVTFLFVEFIGKKGLYSFARDIYISRQIIMELAKKDLKNRYLGSYLGIVWAFVQPIVSILVFWFVFQVGFRSAPINDYPFILWLVTGIVPWFYFAEVFQGGSTAIIDNAFLVKKIVFKISILPLIRMVSSLFVHLFFVLIIFILYLAYGYGINIHYFEFVYYSLSMFALLIGLNWLTSGLTIFLKDLGQIISIIVQMGFWITPVLWNYEIMPAKYQFILKANPMYYIVQGYRSCFIYHKGFWETPIQTIYFWAITILVFAFGGLVFKKLKPHFADIL